MRCQLSSVNNSVIYRGQTLYIFLKIAINLLPILLIFIYLFYSYIYSADHTLEKEPKPIVETLRL